MSGPSTPIEGSDPLSKAEAIVALRDKRSRVFTFYDCDDVFADPAWDMLLDLFIAFKRQRQIGVSSLCIAARVPPTTALRQINLMIDKGLFVRTPDLFDRRKVYISLSGLAVEMMEQLLS